MIADTIKGGSKLAREATPNDIMSALKIAGSDATLGLAGFLRQNEGLLEELSEYWTVRAIDSDQLLALMRTEEEAISDYSRISDTIHESYGVKLAGYHKSSKSLVNTVDALTKAQELFHSVGADLNPQSRAALISDNHIWVSPRRLDGAIPSLVNPAAIWEIKEYWGVTSGGSKMSDAVYEIQLVGSELRAFEDQYNIHVNHYAILDGVNQWQSRKSDVRRMVDLLHSGILDELVVGREVLTEWPRIVESNFGCAHAAR